MNRSIIDVLNYAELFFCLIALAALVYRKQLSNYRYLAALLSVHALTGVILIPLLVMISKRLEMHVSSHVYYFSYWYVYSLGNAIEAVLGFAIIYSMFRMAMAPLKGIQSLGMLIFRWAISISLAVSFGSALMPHNLTGTKFFVSLAVELQRMQSIMTLCLLLFVCFAIHPLGLSYRSRIFGVSLGLSIKATAYLVISAWTSIYGSKHLYSANNIVGGVVTCLIFVLWTAYFILPEPKRRIITLPTTSPFLRWNQISQVLGDEPGFVAIAGIPPELFAPAEIEIMRRASLKMTDNPPVQQSQSA